MATERRSAGPVLLAGALAALLAGAAGCASVSDACEAFCDRYCGLATSCNAGLTRADCQTRCAENQVPPTACAAMHALLDGMSCEQLTDCGSYCAELCAMATTCGAPQLQAPCLVGCTQALPTCFLEYQTGRDCPSVQAEIVCYAERGQGRLGSVVGCGLDVDGDVGKPCRNAADCIGGLGCVDGVCNGCRTRADCAAGRRPVPLCGRDQRCHETCEENIHCPAEVPRCADGVCRCATCRACETDLDCDETQICFQIERICRQRCADHLDCRSGARCATDHCNDVIGTPCDDGYDYCGGSATCAETDAYLRTVLDRYCTYGCYAPEDCPPGYVCDEDEYACLRL